MNTALRRTARASTAVLVVCTLGLAAAPAAHAATIPAAPADIELTAGSDSSISLEWPAVAGATSYRIYRGTASGGEAGTPIASTTNTQYKDANLSSTQVYFYQITAVNSAGE